MPKWRDLRRFLNKHARYIRSGDDLIYEFKGQIVRCSKSSGEISHKQWLEILSHELRISQEEFNKSS